MVTWPFRKKLYNINNQVLSIIFLINIKKRQIKYGIMYFKQSLCSQHIKQNAVRVKENRVKFGFYSFFKCLNLRWGKV